jgi:hypothetical protein
MQRRSLVPLRDLRLLSSPQGVLIILWVIREKGPLSFARLFDLVCIGEPGEFPTGDIEGTGMVSLSSASRRIAEACKTLIEGGLVELVDGSLNQLENEVLDGDFRELLLAKDAITLRVTPTLGFVQDMFEISLYEQAAQSERSIKIVPSFGLPTPGNWPDIFVVMPFQESLKPIYEQHILPVARGLDLTCKRGDDFFSDESIMDEIWSAIWYSKMCIAECTGRNANVFYEMGIAHTIGRPCILIAQSIQDVPFDVQHRRVIIYENTPPGLRKFRDTLSKAIMDELGIERNKLREIFDKLE